jgi:hypothetical protein
MLAGVAASDVYLLLLGPHYGYRFPDTGQSPTHDEWMAARAAGKPRLVFRKTGVDFDDDQEAFAAMVGNYSTGAFWAEYADVPDLQTKVVSALVNLAAAPSPLSYERLDSEPVVQWREDWKSNTHTGLGRSQQDAYVELHVVPLSPATRSSRQMGELQTPVLERLRAFGALSPADGASVTADETSLTIETPAGEGRRFNSVRRRRLAGVRVAKSGQLSIWFELPGDGMGSMLDLDDLMAGCAEGLRLIGAMNLLVGDKFAVAAGIGGSTMLMSVARPTETGRNHATMGRSSDGPVRVIPDESVSAAGFDLGADEVARTIAADLVRAFSPP